MVVNELSNVGRKRLQSYYKTWSLSMGSIAAMLVIAIAGPAIQEPIQTKFEELEDFVNAKITIRRIEKEIRKGL